MNPFLTFTLKPLLTIDEDKLKQLYQNLAAQNHPDKGGDKTTFDTINKDYQILLSPAKRLKAYMEACDIAHDFRGAVSNDLMDLFMQVSALVQQADAFIRKKSAATSVLAKALLEGESMELQDQLSTLIQSIEHNEDTIIQSFQQVVDQSTLPQTARNLAFLEKWRAQLQQRYGALF